MNPHLLPLPPKRRPNATTFLAGILAAMALLVGLVFTSEAIKHQGNVTADLARADAAEKTLKSITYDAKGKVVAEDRMRYADAMATVKSISGNVGTMRGIAQTEWMIAAGCLLATVGLGVLAFASTKPKTATIPTAPRVVSI